MNRKIICQAVAKKKPLQKKEALGYMLKNSLKPPLPLLAKEGIKPVTEGLQKIIFSYYMTCEIGVQLEYVLEKNLSKTFSPLRRA